MRPFSLRLLSTAAIALASTISACDSSLAPGETLDAPIVDVSTATVNPGAIVDMRTRNVSASSWYFNVCSSPRLQRREGDAWVNAPDPLILCTTEVETLRAGQDLTIGVGVPIGSAAGTYRIVFRIARRDGVEAAPTTNTFEVQ